MKHFRAITIGAMVWGLVFTSFIILAFVPVIKDSLNIQALLVGVLIVPYSIIGANIYYKRGIKENGISLGIITALTSLILDALITVPFIEIPKGGSYQSFYSFPLLWLLVMLNIATIYCYWKLKIQRPIS